MKKFLKMKVFLSQFLASYEKRKIPETDTNRTVSSYSKVSSIIKNRLKTREIFNVWISFESLNLFIDRKQLTKFIISV